MARKESNHFDLIIVGSGISGLSTAFHLWQKNYRKILLLSSPRQTPVTAGTAGLVAPGIPDNFTRLSHQYGKEMAKHVWHAGDQAYLALKKYCQEHRIPSQWSKRFRMASSRSEEQELKQALSQMRELGFELESLADLPCQKGSNIEGLILEESIGSGHVQVEALLKSLKPSGLVQRSDHIQSVTCLPNHIELLGESNTYQAEVLVLAGHVGISDLLSLPDQSLVPYADQWNEFEIKWNGPGLSPGTVFTFQHGYLWGVVKSERSIGFGGARFLRPMAGIGELNAITSRKVSEHLRSELERCFPGIHVITQDSGRALLDIRPCDEIPVVGPMFGEHRILMATGFMGYGLSWGFWAGQQLATLIDQGNAPDLPRKLWPERFRSLET